MIRMASMADLEVLVDLNRHGHDVHRQRDPGRFKPWNREATREATREALAKSLEKPAYHTLLAVEDGAARGYCMAFERVVPESPFRYGYRSLFMDQLVVVPDYRMQGLGNALIKAFESLAKARQLDVLELNCWSLNTEAQNLYDRRDYRALSSLLVKNLLV